MEAVEEYEVDRKSESEKRNHSKMEYTALKLHGKENIYERKAKTESSKSA